MTLPLGVRQIFPTLTVLRSTSTVLWPLTGGPEGGVPVTVAVLKNAGGSLALV